MTNHAMLRRFSHGRIAGVDLLKDGLYPLLHVDPQGFTIDNQIGFNVQVYILDKPRDKDDYSKQEYQREVISDCERIMEQLVAEIQNGGNVFLFSESWSVQTPTTSEVLIESYNHVLTGVQASLVITAAWGIDACEIPVTPNPTPPSPTCEDATVTINGTAFDTVGSGDTIDVPVEYVNGSEVGSLVSGVWTIPNPASCSTFDVRIYLDSVLQSTTNIPICTDQTINVNWN